MISEADAQGQENDETKMPVEKIKEILSSLKEKKQKYEEHKQQIDSVEETNKLIVSFETTNQANGPWKA